MGQQGKKQIIIGMLTDQAGCPVSVEVFAGNASDQSTVMDRIDSMRKKYGIAEMVFIDTRGMLTRAKRNDLTAKEYEKIKYITALSRDEFTRFVKDDDHLLRLSLFDRSKLVQVQHDGSNYVLSNNPDLEERNCADRDRMLEKAEAVRKGVEASAQKGRLRQEKRIAKRLFSKFDKWKCARFALKIPFEAAAGQPPLARTAATIAGVDTLACRLMHTFVFTHDARSMRTTAGSRRYFEAAAYSDCSGIPPTIYRSPAFSGRIRGTCTYKHCLFTACITVYSPPFSPLSGCSR